MIVDLTWTTFKTFVADKSRVRYVDRDSFYLISYIDASGELQTSVLKDAGANQVEFETSYQSFANKPVVNSVSVTSDPLPFAQPTHRTKRDATAAVVEVPINTSKTIDYLITEERYCTGGRLIVENAAIGDWVSAEVFDLNGVIPEAYRPLVCEAWPTVAKYIIKEWIVQSGVHEISTYPLNAKITPGLYLRVTYYAANSGIARKVAINYYLTKKI